MQFAIHGLLGAFTMLNSTLGELPRMLPNAFSPENLVVAIKKYYADIGSIPFTVKHEIVPQIL
jgi:hypothetical protein